MALNNSSVSKFDVLHFGVLNLNYSRYATSLLSQDIGYRGLDIIYLMEPYYLELGITNFSSKYVVVATLDKPRTAIVIANRQIKYTILSCEREPY